MPARSPYVPLRYSAAAEDAEVAVADALRGSLPPCAADPALFFKDSPAAVLEALRACGRCPARHPCRRLGEALKAPEGVWGGTQRFAPKPKKLNEKEEL